MTPGEQASTDPRLPLWTLGEAAAYFKVTTNTIRNWQRAGQIDAIKLPGGSWRIANDEIKRILP